MRKNRHIVSARGMLGIVTVAIAVATTGSQAAARLSSSANESTDRAFPAASTFDRTQAQILDAYAKLPVSFVENGGQMNSRVRYYAQGHRYAFYVTQDEVVLSFAKEQATPGVALALRFLHSNPSSVPEGADRVPGEFNYFVGADPAGWHTRLSRFERVMYRELWPGVDLQLHEQSGVLKYEFRVRPGGRPTDIRLAFAGSDGLTLDASGALLIQTAMGVLRDSAPVAYQEIGGARVPVKTRFVLDGGRGHGFAFALDEGYQTDHELIMDPAVEYTTFIGGSSDEIGAGIAVDAARNVYVVGTTQSPDFPTTASAFRRAGAASNISDVFVTKLNATGTALVYSTFIGGSDFDFGRRIAIDASGNAYITGQTKSSNFPTTGGAFDRTLNIPPNCPRCTIDNYDAFVTKLSASGSALVYSTFLGGTDIDDARGIAVDGAGNAYVTGETVSVDFPTTAGALNRTNHGAYDVFVTKLNTTGTALVYSTYLGGTLVDNGERVAVDTGGNAYVMGFTSSIDFPTTPGAFDTTANGGFDVFVARLNATGSALIYSTYLGGQDSDSGGGLAIDAAGNAYISGGTASLDFPTTPGAFDTLPDGNDAFLTKLNAAGSALVYSTVFGGTAGEGASAVAVDPAGNAWLTGTTSSVDFPVTAGAADSTFNGIADAFISELSPDGSTLVYSTFLGGTQSDSGVDLALDSAGNVYVTGHTVSMDFPATRGAFDTVFNGDPSLFWGDAFVTKIASDATTAPPPAPPSSLQGLTLNPSTVVGGSGAQGTITLTSGAPSTGAAVSLSSSNPNVAAVPAGVTVPAGAVSGTFNISTTAVSASTAVTISATYNGTTQAATLTVTPPAPPPQTATLTVAAIGRSGEQITSTPAGIVVATGTTGSASFGVGTAITLTVSNGRDAIWSGACSSGGTKTKSCTLTLTASATVTANVQ